MIAIVVTLAVAVFFLVGSLGGEDAAFSNSNLSESRGGFSVILMGSGNADSIKYLVDGNVTYIVDNPEDNVGLKFDLSDYYPICEGSEVTAISTKNDSEQVTQTHEVTRDINCSPSITTGEYDGDANVVTINAVNSLDSAADFSFAITDGDNIEFIGANSFNPGESIDYTHNLDNSDINPDKMEIITTSESGNNEDAELSGDYVGSDNASWGSGSTSGTSSTVTPRGSEPVSNPPVASSDDAGVASSDDAGVAGPSIVLSSQRVVAGDAVGISANVKSTYTEEEPETMTVHATPADGGETKTFTIEGTLEPESTTTIIGEFTLNESGTYTISAEFETSDEFHHVGTLEVLPDTDFTLASATVTPTDGNVEVSGDVSNEGTDSGEVTLVFFEDGIEVNRETVTISGESSGNTITYDAGNEAEYHQYHVGLYETGEILFAGESGTYEGDFVSFIEQPNPSDPYAGEDVELSAKMDAEYESDITGVMWSVDGTEISSGSGVNALSISYTFDEAGTYDVEIVITAGENTSTATRTIELDETPPAEMTSSGSITVSGCGGEETWDSSQDACVAE